MKFTTEKQKLLLGYLLSSPDVFTIAAPIIKPQYFNPELRNTVNFIFSYYDTYNSLPTQQQISVETATVIDIRTMAESHEIQYSLKEIEKFCKFSAVKSAIFKLAENLEDQSYQDMEDVLKEALLVSITKHLGLRYFENVDERLRRMLVESVVEETGWACLDEALYGGIGRKEMILFSAGSGGGKSITLSNLGINFVKRQKNVLYISFELHSDVVAQRFDNMISGYSRKNWKDNIEDITKMVTSYHEENSGVLDIHQMLAGTTPFEVNAFLKEYYLYHGFAPDLLILDYLDQMNPNGRSSDGIWDKDKMVSEQCRNIAIEWDLCLATASQLNRSAVGQERFNHSHISGGISKINTTDVWVTILMDEIRKMKGEIQFQLGKTRNSDGVDQILDMRWDPAYLRIYDKSDINIRKAKMSKPIPPAGQMLKEYEISKNQTKIPASIADLIAMKDY